MSDKTELPKEDLNLIAQIDAKLKHYNLIAPIEQVEQPKEEVKERWKPSFGCKYWYVGIYDFQFFVADFHWGNDDVDFINHDTGNCFKTEQEAQSAANKIKALLQTR